MGGRSLPQPPELHQVRSQVEIQGQSRHLPDQHLEALEARLSKVFLQAVGAEPGGENQGRRAEQGIGSLPVLGGDQHGRGSTGGRIEEVIQVAGLHQRDIHRQPEDRFGSLFVQQPRSPVHRTALGNLLAFPKHFPAVPGRIAGHFRVAGHNHNPIGKAASTDGGAHVLQHGPGQVLPLAGGKQPGQALLGSRRILDGKKDDRHHGPIAACARATLSPRPAMTVLVTLTCIPRPSISGFRALS